MNRDTLKGQWKQIQGDAKRQWVKLTDSDLRELAARYGAAAARRICQLSRDAVREFIHTLQGLEIPCDLAERRSVYYTLQSEAVRDLAAEHRRRRAAGFGGQWLDAG